MPTWKKVIVSGSQAHLAAVTASTALLVGTNQQITTSPSTTFLSGSFSGSFSGNINATITTATTASVTSVTDTTTGDGPYYIAFKDATTGHPLDRVDSTGLRYNATTNALTASIFIATGSGVNLIGTASWASTASVGSTVSTTTDNTGTTYYVPFVASATGVTSETLRVDSGISYVPSTDTLTLAGDLAVNGGDITTSATTFNLLAGATTAINIGASATTVAILGNLEVRGTTTTVSSSNLLVADRYILLSSGSTSATDGGIIVQSAAGGTGFAYFLDNTPSNPRWGFTSSLSSTDNSTNFVAFEYVVSARTGSADPTGNPTYGGASFGHGNMFINSTDESIWIWS